MTVLPELEEFRRLVSLLLRDNSIASTVRADGRLALSTLTLDEVSALLRTEVSYYFLLAATGLNRTSLRRLAAGEEALLVPARSRRAFAIRSRLPVSEEFSTIASNALALRQADLQRKARGRTEQFFRDRLVAEGIPLCMSPPRRVVPGVVIAGRKPDGVWPDPSTGRPPILYLEIKRIQRVSDDIQKRLYELAEASLEMKLLYGSLEIKGLALTDSVEVALPTTVERLRGQIVGQTPIVIGLFLCPSSEAERYRRGAQSFIDRIFFQEEIDECISYIDEVIKRFSSTV